MDLLFPVGCNVWILITTLKCWKQLLPEDEKTMQVKYEVRTTSFD
jgi:hypothetical protein